MRSAEVFAAILIGLGGMKLIELYKEACQRLHLYHQPPWWKSFLTLVVCVVLAQVFVDDPWKSKVLVGFGAAGFAALVHAYDTYQRHRRDDIASQVLARSRTRR